MPLARFQDWTGRLILDPSLPIPPDQAAYRTITDDGFPALGFTAPPGVGPADPRPVRLSPRKGILGLSLTATTVLLGTSQLVS